MKKLITFKDIDNARKTLGLGESATMEDIKNNYRKLLMKFHPDKYNNNPDKKIFEEKVKDINRAYKIIMNYCIKYPVSFSKSKVRDIEEGEYRINHFKKFYYDWFGDID